MDLKSAFTTNSILAGLTLTIALTCLVSAAWVTRNTRKQVKMLQPHMSCFEAVTRRHTIRIATGFSLLCYMAGLMLLLRQPLRWFREANNAALGAEWLTWSIYWEGPLAAVALAGMVMIMWPAFSKYGRVSSLLGVIAGLWIAVFLLGWAATRIMAAFF